MSYARNDEAKKLWDLLLLAERMPVKNENDFNAKKREIERLRLAYAKVTGMPCKPGSLDENEAKGNAALFGTMRGGPEHRTRDEYNND